MSNKSGKSIQEKSDAYLIRAVKKDASSEAFVEVCRRYQDLFYKICQKYSSTLSACGIFLQDIFNEKDAIIFHCIKTFNPAKKTKLSSWIGNYARYLCLNSINSKKLLIPTPDSEVHKRIEEQQVCHEYFLRRPNLEESRDYVFDLLSRAKDKRIKKVFEYRYLRSKKMIWQKIAEKMNTSPQTVMSLHKKGLILIHNKIMDKENSCDLI